MPRIHSRFVLEQVAERSVSEIVEKGDHPNGGDVLILEVNTLILHRVHHALSGGNSSYRVKEPRVCRPWIDEVSESELLDASETLKLGVVYDREFRVAELDVTPNRVPDYLGHYPTQGRAVPISLPSRGANTDLRRAFAIAR